ncbi:Putative outer membrane protein, probably involved in in nutrient binding protein [Indibacter alkaliphilus LW1]|uniref:Outer membrane protein, probably involved in in nutrient binding protein n=1 Tax=Indibacter alkaliphilus (strain CCUG 57479 / KCTC 22604 / LW1) TaxID=1189612 RepID=S2D7Y5_INDAL|nr:RagB/SusD family nutrient uptake outer membrane protein [Indibacter alkaliphilus]EOZ95332.1 Putative outer membrane protein, probably involved in in nutrient binding protein [Indibacter alkaliphilus LW1]
MKNYIIRILLLSGLLLHFSCEDYIERLPLDSPSSASFFNNRTEVDMGLFGCYERIVNRIGIKGNLPWIVSLDCTTDINWNRSATQVAQLGNGTASSENLSARNVWRDFYAVIARTNFLLDNLDNAIETVDPVYLAQVSAEARFLRAYSYFYLSEFFGGVPLITASIKIEESQMPRTSKSEIANWIIAEMDEVAPDLPINFDGNMTGRATRVAAYFLKAYTALTNERWQVAAQAAKTAIDLGYYDLHPDYAELFTYDGETSRERIFAMQYMVGLNVHPTFREFGSRLAAGVSNEKPTLAFVDSYECIDGLPIDKSPLFDPSDPFTNRDPRLHMTVAVPGTIHLGFQFETHPDSLQVWNYNTSPPARVNNTDATNPFATFTNFLWRKWMDERDLGKTQENDGDIILMRFAELLLIYAEAKIELNELDDSVFDALNRVRNRVGMPDVPRTSSQSELRTIVRRERKVELAMEGRRLIDIRRWRIAEKVMNGPRYGNSKTEFLSQAPVLDENTIPDYSGIPNVGILRVVETMVFDPNKHYLWPIHPVELQTNTALEQNPGW